MNPHNLLFIIWVRNAVVRAALELLVDFDRSRE